MTFDPPLYMQHVGIDGVWAVNRESYYNKWVNEDWTLVDSGDIDGVPTRRTVEIVGEFNDGQFPRWDAAQGAFVASDSAAVWS